MGRIARVVAVGVAHHVTQRGNGRRFLLESEADRRVYLDLLRENLALHEVLLVGYCLMSNHVHLIVIPTDAEGSASSMKHTHGRYASYWNVVHSSSGHAWQGRYFSCPLGAWGCRFTPASRQLSIRARLLEEGGERMWKAFMAELRSIHMGAPVPRRSVCAELRAAFESPIRREDKARTSNKTR